MGNLNGERLILRADASTQIGSGHLMRCLALAQAWKDAGGEVTFITACQGEGLLERLRDAEFDIKLLSSAYPDIADWNSTRDILSGHPGARVVLDGYHFDEVYQHQVIQAGHPLLVIDDNAHLKHYYADIVLNQNLHTEQLHYSCEPYTRLLLGTRYVLLRREFLAWKKERHREIPEVARRVLVTLGGGDPDNNTLKVIQALQEVGLPDLEATVVIGASNPHAGILEQAAKQSCIPIRLVRDAKNMPKLIAWADVAVSGGGTTAWELLFMGAPSLFLIVADNQRYIAEYIGNQGFGKNLGMAQNISTESLTEAITSLAKESNLRATISRKARQLVDGQGARRVVRSMQEEKKNGGYPLRLNNETTQANSSSGGQRKLRVVFMGSKQAGCIGLLTAIAADCRIQGVVAYGNIIGDLATNLGLPTFNSFKLPSVEELLTESDLLISVHLPYILPKRLLELPRLGCINVHPCLYLYKGLHPIDRFLSDGHTKASVGVHRMTEEVDAGEVLVEEYVDVTGKRTVEEIYNVLYPYYSIALLKALRVLNCSV